MTSDAAEQRESEVRAVKIAEILRSKGHTVATIHPEQSVFSAIKEMKSRAVGALVVSTDATTVAGIVSERDVVRALCDGPGVLDRPVADIMTSKVVTCSADDTVTRAMAVMTHRRHRHLPVVAGGKLSGIVSLGDLVKARLEEVELESRVLRDVYLATH
jgi:CBS domain-containing protein